MDEKIKKKIVKIDVPLNVLSEEDFIKQNPKMFVVRSHIGQQFNKMGHRMSFKTLDRINYMVARIIKDSCYRCKKNGRITVRPCDI